VNRIRAAIALSLLFLGGCGKEQHASLPPIAAEEDTTPKEGGTLIRRLQSDVSTLNPLLANTRYEHFVAFYLFTPLLQLDANLLPTTAGSLSDKYEVSADGRTFTFHLNPKATFSDGTPVRASDVLFTMRKIVDPASEAANVAGKFELFDPATSSIVDEHTVIIAFKEALASLVSDFTFVRVIPEHVYGKGDFKTAFNTTAVGSGPYKLGRRVIGKEILLERRADYWGTLPHIQDVLFKVVLDDNTAWNAIKRGDLDESIITSDVWLMESRRPELQKLIDFRRFYTLGYNFVAWNTRDPVLSDKRVRRALAMCVDLQSVINNVYHGTARAMTGPFSPDQWAYNPEVPAIQYDAEAARRTLESIGWRDTDGDGILDKNHTPLRVEFFIFTGSSTAKTFAQLFQSELKKVGVDLKITSLDPGAFFEKVLNGNFQSAYLSWDLDPDPDPFPMYHSSQFPPKGQNFVFYASPEADALIEQGRREIDRAKRIPIYRRLHAVLADDQPYTWTIQVSTKWAINKRVRNVKESKGWGLYLWYPGELDWWIAPR
jgi:peptide/nickel transport system substrate-binding protein